SGVSSCGGLRTLMPALLTRMSMRPRRARTAATASATWSGRATSAVSTRGSVTTPAARAWAAWCDLAGVRGARAEGGAPVRRARGEGQADAAVAAGDDGDLARQIEQGEHGHTASWGVQVRGERRYGSSSQVTSPQSPARTGSEGLRALPALRPRRVRGLTG